MIEDEAEIAIKEADDVWVGSKVGEDVEGGDAKGVHPPPSPSLPSLCFAFAAFDSMWRIR